MMNHIAELTHVPQQTADLITETVTQSSEETPALALRRNRSQ